MSEDDYLHAMSMSPEDVRELFWAVRRGHSPGQWYMDTPTGRRTVETVTVNPVYL